MLPELSDGGGRRAVGCGFHEGPPLALGGGHQRVVWNAAGDFRTQFDGAPFEACGDLRIDIMFVDTNADLSTMLISCDW